MEDRMDPNATLRDIDEFIDDTAMSNQLVDLCDALHTWLLHGGYEPDWTAYPSGASYYLGYHGLPHQKELFNV